MVNDAVDSALDSEDIEEEIEEEVDKVLTDIAGETAAQLPEAARRERTKLPAQRAEVAKEVCASTTIFPCVWSQCYFNAGDCEFYVYFAARSYTGGG